MDPKKIKAIINWQELKNIKDIKAFIKFANFYQQFILGIKASSHYLGQVEASCLHIRQAAFT